MKRRRLVRTLLMIQLVGLTLTTIPTRAVAADLTDEQRYWAGYRVGVIDAHQHQNRHWEDPFIRAGYQRGLVAGQQGQSQLEQTPQDPPAENEKATTAATSAPALPLAGSQRQFIDRLVRHAQELGRRYDLYPSVLLAQAALESNWGQSDLAVSHHNLFGVKALPGQAAVALPTLEQAGQGMVKTTAAFCHYRDEEQALFAYAQLLQSPNYAGVHRTKAATFREATRALTGVFATDSHYDQKLNQLIETYHLDEYDHFTKASPRKTQPQVPEKGQEKPLANSGSHQPTRSVQKEELAWYWWPVSIISGGSLTWLVDHWRHRNR